MTIRTRLLAFLVPALLLALVAGGTATYLIARANLLRQLDAAVAARAEALASLVTFDEDHFEFEFDEAQERDLGEVYFEFRAEDGAVLRRSRSVRGEALPVADEGRAHMSFADARLPDGRRGRGGVLTFQPRLDDPAELADQTAVTPPPLVVAVAVQRGETDRALAALRATLMLVGAGLGVACLLLVGIGSRWALRPLRDLRKTVGAIDAERSNVRVDSRRVPAELRPVYEELNAMLERIERALERERTFADATAHELRMPLTELRAAAEVALRFPDAERNEAALAEVLQIGGEMQRLVEALLTISRGRAGDGGEREAATRLAPIVEALRSGCAERLADKALTLTLNVREEAELPAPPGVVEIVLRNLLDNAIAYTPAGGSITIDAPAAGPDSIAIENGPIELRQRDLPHLFDPFWRQDEARSDRRHVGLGLTVVERLAAAAGLRVEARLENERLRLLLVTGP